MKGDHMNGTRPALPPALEALLVHERVPPPQPELVRARLLARADAVPRDAAPAAPAPRVAPSRSRWPFFAAAAGITIVAGVAAAFQMMGRPPLTQPGGAESPPTTASPPVASPSTEPEPASKIPRALEPASGPVRVSSPSRRASAGGKHDGPLAEIQLLTRARQADVRGDYTDVLAVLAEHERRHPAGRLSEEREVLRVKALVGLGRGSEARSAAVRFRQQFPRSVLLPKVEEILSSLP
jgi:hypothetical protein